ncbi:MAG: DUF2911 domain-containing protein [Balneola sp.]
MKPFRFLFIILLAITSWNCTSTQNSPDNAGYITLLGNDTLAVEMFKKTEDGVNAKVVLRSPKTTLTSYELKTNETGGIEELTMTNHDPMEGFDSTGEVARSYMKDGDSLIVSIKTNDGSFRVIKTEYEAGVLPFIDMVHWPFEVAFNNAMKSDADSIDQRLLSGSRTSNFIVAKIKSDSMTIRHPSRGVMGVQVDGKGNIVELDASETTRKLTVKRVSSVDIGTIAARFAESDKEGSPFGALSGAEESEFNVDGAQINISYGTPLRRGRDLFGGIVAYGERWRTGANRATHFSTTKDLQFEGLNVPAGDYTLFSIPEADGGTLIINKQTGQNGQTYDEARDLGRVPMNKRTVEENTEAFTILVTDEGVLELIWGNTVYSIPFTVK